MLKIICLGIACQVKIEKLQFDVSDKAAIAVAGRNPSEVTPLTNALGYVQIFKESVPAALNLLDGLLKLGEKREEAKARILKEKADAKARTI